MESKKPSDVLHHRSHKAFLTAVKSMLTVYKQTHFFGEESNEIT